LDFGDVRFDPFGTHVQKGKQFLANLNGKLKDIAKEYNIDNARPDFGLPTLIRRLKKKFNQPVIILIDEYDASVNTALYRDQNRKLAGVIAGVLNGLFVDIKTNTNYLRFVWVTGVTRLGLPALQSPGNGFVDVTLTKELAAAAGFTKDEITSYFKSHIEVFASAHERKFTEKKMMEKLIAAYDGYRFSLDRVVCVLNPISVLSSLKNSD
jgi:phage shock protein PspC (stress-responsive transcriptional regulator)